MSILIDRAKCENFSNYEFLYTSESEHRRIIEELNSISGLVKGDIITIEAHYRDGYTGAVWACVSDDVIETMAYRLRADIEPGAGCVTICAPTEESETIEDARKIGGLWYELMSLTQYHHGTTYLLGKDEHVLFEL